ncbi:MAG: membrane protein insertase YidC [Bacteroidales bacterium]|jgi:YidC/Oxa1 family membrane protein insertase|nr:membrane protein insertase YidC [Bacteroidales bacterium]
MNKNTIIGYVLIILLFLGWMWWMQPSEAEKQAQTARQDSIRLAEIEKKDSLLAIEQRLKEIEGSENVAEDALDPLSSVSARQQLLSGTFGIFSNAADGEQDFFTLDNGLYSITLTNKGGRVYNVELHDYKRFDSLPLYLFDPATANFALGFFAHDKMIATDKLFFEPVWYDTPENSLITLGDADSVRFGMRLHANDDSFSADKDKYIEFRYIMRRDEYMLGFDISFHNMQRDISSPSGSINLTWKEDLNRNEQDLKGEREKTTIYYKIHQDDVNLLSETKEAVSEDLRSKLDWVSFKSRFFLSTIISTNVPFEEALIETEVDSRRAENGAYLQSMNASIFLPWEAQSHYTIPLKFYFGPNKYNTLKEYDAGLEKQVPLGGWLISWINKGVILLFDLMSSWGWNYGIIILILATLIKLILFPIAMKTYRSQAVMRVLKPEIDEINERYSKSEDAMKKQQATMNLYKRAGINPMGGCLPMLLQLPILMAMFRFFPSSLELRQQSFLWATDLSSYDSILNLPFNIPLYGDHVSLFSLLMAISTLIYTRISMKSAAGSNQMPGMKVMMYLMPIMFLGIFNNYASALSYYYLIINLLTFAQMWLMRLVINEDKIHQRIQESKGKPVKKSKWMQRMEEATKQQQKAVQQRSKQQPYKKDQSQNTKKKK